MLYVLHESQTDLNHIRFHLPSLHVGVVNDDGVSSPFKSLLGYGIKLAQEIVLERLWSKLTALKGKQW